MKRLQCCQTFPARFSAFLVASAAIFPHFPSVSLTESIVSATKQRSINQSNAEIGLRCEIGQRRRRRRTHSQGQGKEKHKDWTREAWWQREEEERRRQGRAQGKERSQRSEKVPWKAPMRRREQKRSGHHHDSFAHS